MIVTNILKMHCFSTKYYNKDTSSCDLHKHGIISQLHNKMGTRARVHFISMASYLHYASYLLDILQLTNYRVKIL